MIDLWCRNAQGRIAATNAFWEHRIPQVGRSGSGPAWRGAQWIFRSII